LTRLPIGERLMAFKIALNVRTFTRAGKGRSLAVFPIHSTMLREKKESSALPQVTNMGEKGYGYGIAYFHQ